MGAWLAVLTGFEPVASTLTGWRSLHTDLQDLGMGGRGEDRTLSLRIKSPALFQLSYTPAGEAGVEPATSRSRAERSSI